MRFSGFVLEDVCLCLCAFELEFLLGTAMFDLCVFFACFHAYLNDDCDFILFLKLDVFGLCCVQLAFRFLIFLSEYVYAAGGLKAFHCLSILPSLLLFSLLQAKQANRPLICDGY